MKRPRDQARILVLTGAGISVASGIRPFRGPNGLWSEADTARLSDRSALYNDLAGVWKLWGGLRAQLQTAQPNAAHYALAELERNLKPQQELLVVTQNVDGLHQRAGSTNVIEYHGSVLRSRPLGTTDPADAFPDDKPYPDGVVPTNESGDPLRPDIVLFREPIPDLARATVNKALRHHDLFIAIGTSGMVYPAAKFVKKAFHAGATTVYVNTDPLPEEPFHFFKRQFIGKAEELLPNVLDFLLG